MKRIGVVIPAITDNLQSELLGGITATAAAAGCDVIVLTTATKGLDFHMQSGRPPPSRTRPPCSKPQ